jgi:hypothetical protein
MSSKDLFFRIDKEPTTGFCGDVLDVDAFWVVDVVGAIVVEAGFAGVDKSATFNGPGVAVADLVSVVAAPNNGAAGFAGVANVLEVVLAAPPNNGFGASAVEGFAVACDVLPNNPPLVLLEEAAAVAAGFAPNKLVVVGAGVADGVVPNKLPVVAVLVGAALGVAVAGVVLPNKFPVVEVVAVVPPNRLGF